jgi:hypothetical protein
MLVSQELLVIKANRKQTNKKKEKTIVSVQARELATSL